jgi:hypothetical protein
MGFLGYVGTEKREYVNGQTALVGSMGEGLCLSLSRPGVSSDFPLKHSPRTWSVVSVSSVSAS